MIALASISWFAKSNIPTTYYIIREAANNKYRTHKKSGEDIESLFDAMNSPTYINTGLIIHDLSAHSRKIFHYHGAKALKKFHGQGIVVKDRKIRNHGSGAKKWHRRNFFDDGVIHGMCTLNNVVHIAVYMGYKRIIFAGVDLYDSRYFWLPKNETRHTVKQKNRNCKNSHSTSIWVLNMINELKTYQGDIKLYTYNPKSLLKKAMPVWKWD